MTSFNILGQSYIPQGVITRCYTNGDCTGEINEELSQLFVSSSDNENHCCYDGDITDPRPNPEMLSFTLNGGECRRCDGKAMHTQLLQKGY